MKYLFSQSFDIDKKSPPSRGAWIEIIGGIIKGLEGIVAPLTGGVD